MLQIFISLPSTCDKFYTEQISRNRKLRLRSFKPHVTADKVTDDGSKVALLLDRKTRVDGIHDVIAGPKANEKTFKEASALFDAK